MDRVLGTCFRHVGKQAEAFGVEGVKFLDSSRSGGADM